MAGAPAAPAAAAVAAAAGAARSCSCSLPVGAGWPRAVVTEPAAQAARRSAHQTSPARSAPLAAKLK